jgi:hypothetical protein
MSNGSSTIYYSLATGTADFVQCLPAMSACNIWNMNDTIALTGLLSTDRIEVVMEDFSFAPSNLSEIVNGAIQMQQQHLRSSRASLIQDS